MSILARQAKNLEQLMVFFVTTNNDIAFEIWTQIGLLCKARSWTRFGVLL